MKKPLGWICIILCALALCVCAVFAIKAFGEQTMVGEVVYVTYKDTYKEHHIYVYIKPSDADGREDLICFKITTDTIADGSRDFSKIECVKVGSSVEITYKRKMRGDAEYVADKISFATGDVATTYLPPLKANKDFAVEEANYDFEYKGRVVYYTKLDAPISCYIFYVYDPDYETLGQLCVTEDSWDYDRMEDLLSYSDWDVQVYCYDIEPILGYKFAKGVFVGENENE